MSPEMLQKTLAQAAQQLQTQLQPAHDLAALMPSSIESKGPSCADDSAMETATQPKYVWFRLGHQLV